MIYKKTKKDIDKIKLFSNIEEIYSNFLLCKTLTHEELTCLLLFYHFSKNYEDLKNVRKKIRVLFFNYYKIDYLFYEYILKEGLYPLLRNYFLNNKNFKEKFQLEVIKDFELDGKTLTYDQYQFFTKVNNQNNSVFIAPTSFGKSSAIIKKINENPDKKILIIVPSKLLISQFSTEIINKMGIKPITHPDQRKLTSNIYILTQERVHTLLSNDKDITFDILFVDEAHHLMEKENRSHILSAAIINIINRNKKIAQFYFTPFSLEFSFSIEGKYGNNINKFNSLHKEEFTEKIKVKRYFVIEKDEMYLYDEVFGKLTKLEEKLDTKKEIIYFNKPISILNYVEKQIDFSLVKNVDENIKEILGVGETLFSSISQGYYIIFGLVPYSIRSYILEKFNDDKNGKLVVNAAALEGVNTNANTVRLIENRIGLSNLRGHQIENLVGRANRLKDLVNDKDRLITDVLFEVPKNSTKEKMLKYLNKYLSIQTLKNENSLQDESTLSEWEEVTIDSQIEEDFKEKIKLNTEVGKIIAKNNIWGIDVKKSEERIQQNIDNLNKLKIEEKIEDHEEINSTVIIDKIIKIFVDGVEFYEKRKKDKFDLKKLSDENVKKYYEIIFDYFIKNFSSKEVILRTLKYWDTRLKKDINYQAYLANFGSEIRKDKTYSLKHKKNWITISSLSEREKNKYATIKTLQEIDVIELYIIPFIRIMLDLDLISEKFYNLILYSTDEEFEVEAKKAGISNDLFLWIKNKGIDFSIFFQDNQEIIKNISKDIENEILKKEFEILFIK